eukprot:CAMPEP_0197876094 /NCGR_PEP_ID=MMETSP1439-20131203/5165_1 /TAXON_ID=66791 /ORGANISM="Gonyaulax spinifera, Strain CCMP409" /LENGTH=477 /DNA_ID=CAMNT_0043495363 /DNA_START=106 /DNA_END=1536 /DNA_ORIENTATION=-
MMKAVLWAAVAALQVSPALGVWTLLPSGSLCTDYQIPSATSAAECFTVAAPAVSLSGKATLEMNGLGFTGCVYNPEADTVMYGVSTNPGSFGSIQHICNGIPTTTITTTMTTTTTQPTTLVGGSGIYTEIDFHLACIADFKVPDIGSAADCFGPAATYLGYQGMDTLELNGLGFTGCVHNYQANKLIYSETINGVGQTSYVYKYLCDGLATTTITVTSTTKTTSTSTVTTATTTSSTKTSSTTTMSTSTISTTTRTSTGSSTSTRTTSTSTFTTTTMDPNAAFLGDDPITYYNNQMRRFYLPEGQMTRIFATPEVHLYVAAFRLGDEQYITRLALTSPEGDPVMQVAIRDGLEAFVPEEQDSGSFATMNVTLDWIGQSLTRMPAPDDFCYEWRTMQFAFARIPNQKIGQAHAEIVIVSGRMGKIIIASTEALGFEGDQAHLGAKFAHLDFILQMKNKSTCEGILPELWGTKPMSDST